ncbi:excinuclease ABC subunit A [Candidatus Woesebacteria bacterium RIFCSPHIGHO2_02_FULL_42_20]|uniref:UvrABC system protein A n=1 Tax=Candidatus Woesebacteria bacterium RIFCSPHIGHO2_12_FULL_41_24 TaxID=1802510 RepID=A0A1F8AQX2_9BACT|nr:MAG: excinuclease ABC subunit A [Candidatus Woesebacteria bacterium RBG_16_41_13]OGM30714.1 MAG: excinuclease ABC subunit A [Candidatus Woesebacteria bacterium RIFCSPHIGHO2_01_FULL_42_80]OGM35851.1 MAG: excinuclease ABC subunit A [Candidatus Woesebacteria bacterium RIFCSPHIGHO2_02_FULL_42_20]OGM53909.1 MAG: excinuclease ABC subunit A [Candidatus Woesebacteria bacterium RIFCSPHIGHO2_12_FULL_41_24]OGM66101.1 MAG: excinuclease ABC subunit A [Candidatus Woesebacteria bacterium RIFCSPLOWO2_01_FUL
MQEYIKVRGARQHNLKNIDIDIPKNKLVVFTGVSGSGKSSLAFDTIYAEGQRRYVESLSTYARQFLGVMDKPDVDFIEGLSPAISIDQKTTSHNPRSTVGTITEVYDYLRLLFARVGHPHCPICGREIASQSLDQIVTNVIDLISGAANGSKVARFVVMSPLVKDRKGEFSSLLDNLRAKGLKYVRIDGIVKGLNEDFYLLKNNKHTIDVFIDRLSIEKRLLKDRLYIDNLTSRLSESVGQALKLADGQVIVSQLLDKSLTLPEFPKEFSDHLYSEKFSCPVDNISLPPVEPRTFSFNSPHGACPKCLGLGSILKVEPDLLFAPQISVIEGGVIPFASMFEHDTWFSRIVKTFCERERIDIRMPIVDLTQQAKDLLLYGKQGEVFKVDGINRMGSPTSIYESFDGFVGELTKRHAITQSDYVRAETERYMRETACEECLGTRLKKESLSITIKKKSIAAVSDNSVTDLIGWLASLAGKVLNARENVIAGPILNEIVSRLSFLSSVGLGYLTTDRKAATLAGGELQRIRLASQIGSGLTGVLYVLDEPTIGLHPRDNAKLIKTLSRLRDMGNTVLVVEHDRDMIMRSDFVFDFGPGAGKMGGKLIASGTPADLVNDKSSITAKYLNGSDKIIVRPNPITDKITKEELTLTGAAQFNLKSLDLTIPLSKLVTVTGVSGSGKSTLIVDTLYHALMAIKNPFHKQVPGKHKSVINHELIDKVVLIDQSPIGRTPRSNPATYTKVFDLIRDLFASTRDAKALGLDKGKFSFNVKGGRCETCEGQGQIKIEMQFMSDIWVTCEVCKGSRYTQKTLEVQYRAKNISDVLNLSVTEALDFFHSHPVIINKLDTLQRVGLDYIDLGQPATTLSGGEAQRVKLASELSRRATGKTFYILDEPTTGLHFADLEKLLKVLRTLVDRGNTVVVIEHNLDVVKNADWIIDLGPEGGDNGGYIVGVGTPEQIAHNKKSYTGQFLKKVL